MLRFIISVLALLLGSAPLFGQFDTQIEDTTIVRPPKPPKVKKEPREYIPTGIRVGVDLNSFARNLWDENKKLTEYQLDIDARHFLLAFEYGTSEVEENEPDFSYQNKGTYFRIGPEVNFLYDPDKLHVVFAGFRYASSTFDDILTYETEDAYGNTEITAANDNGKAQWAELVAGTKVNLWKGLFLGFTLRYKFIKTVDAEGLIPYWLPGYGENRLDDNDLFGFSYYVYWRFGLPRKNKGPKDPIPE